MLAFIKFNIIVVKFVPLVKRTIERRVCTKVEINILIVCVCNKVLHTQAVAVDRISHLKAEFVRVLRQRLFIFGKKETQRAFILSVERKLHVPCKSVVCLHGVLLALCRVFSVLGGTDKREKDRSIALPCVTALPQVFLAVQL